MIDDDLFINNQNSLESTEIIYFRSTPVYKFIILSILTCGFYHAIWAYKLWKTIKSNFDYININVLLRTIFMGITNFSLFKILNKYLQQYNDKGFNTTLFATMYILLIMIGNITDSMIIVPILCTIIIAIIQSKINKVNEIYFTNSEINTWNYTNTIWATILGLIYILIILT